MTNPAIEKLTNFSAGERALAERLLRPQGPSPAGSFENEQLLSWLSRMNAARAPGQPLTRHSLTQAGLLKEEAAPEDAALRVA